MPTGNAKVARPVSPYYDIVRCQYIARLIYWAYFWFILEVGSLLFRALQKGRNQVGKSTNGPDVTDIAVMMSALQSLHDCQVSLTVFASTEGHNGGVEIGLTCHLDTLPGSTLPNTMCTTGKWPNGHGRSFWGEVMQMLYVVDFLIGEAYQQRFLPGVE
jgi:hypothetical protein